MNFERSLYLISERINKRGVQLDIKTIHNAKYLIEERQKLNNEKIKELTNGVISTANQTTVIKDFIKLNYGISLPNMQAATLEEWVVKDIPEQAQILIKIRQEASKSSTSKLNKMLSLACPDGRARGLFVYHGASTGRWAGKYIQTQNLPRGEFKNFRWVEQCIKYINDRNPIGMEILFGKPLSYCISSCIRGMLISAPGKKLMAADYSSVEALVLAWIAGQDDILETMASGRDIYINQASKMFNKPYEEITKGERSAGKVAVLALGYQGWLGALSAMCRGYGIELSEELKLKIAQGYRETNPKIVSLWRIMESMAKAAIKDPSKKFIYKKLEFFMYGPFLKIRLPSGRCLSYYKPKIKSDENIVYWGVNGYTKKWEEIDIYGGKFVEHIVSGASRDLEAHAMVRAENNSYPIVLHTHDELVCEVDMNANLKKFEFLVAEIPPWAEGLPLKAEGWEGRRYRKD